MSDYSPAYTEEDAKLDARKNAADRKIKEVKLKELTVGDLMKVLDVYKHGYLLPSEHDVSLIERILKITE